MLSDKNISKIIAKKTGLYLKISMVLFIISLILLSNAFLFVQQQYNQLRKDFVDNTNTHIITVTRKMGVESNNTYPLTFADEENIKKIINENWQSYTYSEYSIGFGIGDNNDNIYFIKGIDNQIIRDSNLKEIKNNEAIVSLKRKEQNVLLKIPSINVQNGGFTSDCTTDFEMQLIQTSTSFAPFDELDIRPDTIIVNIQTFKEIISIMYNTRWEDFICNYDKNNPYGIEIIETINIYVDNLKDVKNIANRLKDNGYETSYILGAFDDLHSSLNNTYMIYGLLILFILFTTAINIIISFRGYLLNMQKDMGIFRHYGYSPKRVYNIYSTLIIHPYLNIILLVVIYTLVDSLILLKVEFLKPFIITLLVIIVLVMIILAILLKILKKLCEKDIIILLKETKEVE